MICINNEVEFDLWVEGYQNYEGSRHAMYLGKVHGTSFNEAVKNYVDSLSTASRTFWSFDPDRNVWVHWGCNAHDNESDARLPHG